MNTAAYRRYMLGLLLALMALNYSDRVALGLLLQAIKLDLHLSDTELGFLTGISFFLFYSIMGVPLARWADRGNRVTVISVTMTLWSIAMGLCGMAANFVQLLLVRIGVAVGEAGCVPPAHSLIADYFDRSERPKAVAIYKLGGPLSLVIGYFCVGWLNEHYGWRIAFMALGVPGLLLSLLTWLTLREPRRDAARSAPIAKTPSAIDTPSLRLVATTLWANRTFRHLLIAYSIISFFGFGMGQWMPAFFMRSHGLTSGQIGILFGLLFGGAALVGIYLGGFLASRYAANNESLQLRSMAIVHSLFGLLYAAAFAATSTPLALLLIGVATLGSSATIAPLFAAIQTLVPDRMRAMSIALLFLFANLVGNGLGPLAAGVLSDAFTGIAGAESLRYSLIALCPGYLWCSWHVWRSASTIADDLRDAAIDQDTMIAGVDGQAQAVR